MKEFLHYTQQPRVAACFLQSALSGAVAQWKQRGLEVAELGFDSWKLDDGKSPSPCNVADAVAGLLSYAGIPRIAVARLRNEGGQWSGDENARENILRTAIAHCEAVDIELAASICPQIVDAAKTTDCAVIISRHNIHGADTLAVMEESMRRAFDAGADIYKNASMVETSDDVCVLKDFLQKWAGQYPLIVTGMGHGEVAKQSRRELPLHGSRLAFANAVGESAPGQLSLAETVAVVNAARELDQVAAA